MTASTPVVVGAYAALTAEDSPSTATAFADAVLDLDGVDGFEVPLGLTGDEFWFERAARGGRHVVTAVPALAVRTRAQPGFGLASPDARGRRDAIEAVAAVRDQVVRWREHDREVIAVALSSGVPGPRAAASRLAESLREVRSWDWGGALVVLEHCDAVGGRGTPDKGYARLEDELTALARSDGDAAAESGLVVNWGRSAIELRDPHGSERHAILAGDRLVGYMLSGVAGEDGDYGRAWTDAHPPVRETLDPSVSLLTLDRAAQAIATIADRPLTYRGVKTSWRPAGDRLSRRIAALRPVVDLYHPPMSERTP